MILMLIMFIMFKIDEWYLLKMPVLRLYVTIVLKDMLGSAVKFNFYTFFRYINSMMNTVKKKVNNITNVDFSVIKIGVI